MALVTSTKKYLRKLLIKKDLRHTMIKVRALKKTKRQEHGDGGVK